jgi:hypothetical protein
VQRASPRIIPVPLMPRRHLDPLDLPLLLLLLLSIQHCIPALRKMFAFFTRDLCSCGLSREQSEYLGVSLDPTTASLALQRIAGACKRMRGKAKKELVAGERFKKLIRLLFPRFHVDWVRWVHWVIFWLALASLFVM